MNERNILEREGGRERERTSYSCEFTEPPMEPTYETINTGNMQIRLKKCAPCEANSEFSSPANDTYHFCKEVHKEKERGREQLEKNSAIYFDKYIHFTFSFI